ncbi:MAG: diguanylate cyclase [Mizugakiibacter sp.]|uniref:diguanylate cyclase n=1 Tax=Mizugakiibacter sp. TaxID=1972610 RepID=UPI0031C05C4A|nr:diguanylate cyclase [Xanthomonadaceae bacterium]
MSARMPGKPSPTASALRFVARVHGLRTLGLGLGFFAVAAALQPQRPSAAVWVLLVLNGFAWPHVARRLAGHSAHPVRAECRNLMVDSAMGGVWVAQMQFNLLPSVALVAMLAMDKIAVGGWKLLARGLLLQAVACALTAATRGFAFAPATGMFEIAATVPFLALYPLAVSMTMYRLSQRVRSQNRLLARLSSIDDLSELLNRGPWEEAVADALDRHRRDGKPATLLMIDIDHFKSINDRHGHPAGDEVIGRVAAIIRHCVREGDMAGRYGGDEFGVVLHGADAADAAAVAERIRAIVAVSRFGHAEDLRCTLSIGIAQAGEETLDARDWIKQADAALYRAKHDGRNRMSSVV